MEALCLVLKVMLVTLCVYGAYGYSRIHGTDGTRLSIGFIHYLEVGLYIALLLISVLGVNDARYDILLVAVIVLTGLLLCTLRHRLVPIGKHAIYINGHRQPLDEVYGAEHHGLYLLFHTESGDKRVYLPMTSFEAIQNAIERGA